MFLNECQNNTSVPVISPNDKHPIWQATKPSSKQYEQKLKSYILNLESPYSKLKCPLSSQSLALIQPVLVLQLYVKNSSAFSLDITVCDNFGSKRRISFSPTVKEVSVQAVHARVPSSEFYRRSWSNFCVDLGKWTAFCFCSSFKSIESFVLTGSCQVRKIFTIKQAETEQDIYENIGKDLDFPLNALYVNQIVTPQTVVSQNYLELQRKTKKVINRPPITTAPAEVLKQLNISLTFQKTGKTSSEFYNKASPLLLPPLEKDLQNRKFSLEKPFGEKEKNYFEVQRFTDRHNQNSVETMSDNIEEEIETESCFVEESVGHQYFPQVKQLEPIGKPSFFTTAYLEIMKHRPFTPPFEEIGGERKRILGVMKDLKGGLMFDPILNCYYDENTEEYYKDDN